MKKIISLLLAMTLLLAGAVSLASCQPDETVAEYTRTKDGVTQELRLLDNGSFTMTESYETTMNYDASKGDAGKITSKVVKNYSGTWTKTEAVYENKELVTPEIITLKYTGGDLRDEIFATNPSANYNPVTQFHASLMLYQRYLLEQLGMKESQIGTQYYAPTEFTVSFAGSEETFKFYEFVEPGSTLPTGPLYDTDNDGEADSYVNADGTKIGFKIGNGQSVTYNFDLAKYGSAVEAVKGEHKKLNPTYTETTYTITLKDPITATLALTDLKQRGAEDTADLELSAQDFQAYFNAQDADKLASASLSYKKAEGNGEKYTVTFGRKNNKDLKGTIDLAGITHGAPIDTIKWVTEGADKGKVKVTFKKSVSITLKDDFGDTTVKENSLETLGTTDGMTTYRVQLNNGQKVSFSVPASMGNVESVERTATALDSVYLIGTRQFEKSELPSNLRIVVNKDDETFDDAPEEEEGDGHSH